MSNYFDQFDELGSAPVRNSADPAAGADNFFDQFDGAALDSTPAGDGKSAQQAVPDRTWGDVATDTGAAVMGGFASLGGGVAQMVDIGMRNSPAGVVEDLVHRGIDALGVGDGESHERMKSSRNRASQSVQDIFSNAGDSWNKKKSQQMQEAQRKLSGASEGADGFWDEISKTAGVVWEHPELIGDLLAGSLPHMLLPAASARAQATQTFNRLIAGGTSKKAAAEAATKSATKAGAGIGGLMEGASSGHETRSQVMQMTPEQLIANSDTYREMLDMGMSHDEAVRSVAYNSGLTAQAVTTPISVLAAFATGGARVEAEFFTGQGVKNFFGALGREAAQESIQESGNQLGQNVGVRTFADETQSVTEGVGQSATLGAIAGVSQTAGMKGVGGVVGAIGSDGNNPADPSNDLSEHDDRPAESDIRSVGAPVLPTQGESVVWSTPDGEVNATFDSVGQLGDQQIARIQIDGVDNYVPLDQLKWGMTEALAAPSESIVPGASLLDTRIDESVSAMEQDVATGDADWDAEVAALLGEIDQAHAEGAALAAELATGTERFNGQRDSIEYSPVSKDDLGSGLSLQPLEQSSASGSYEGGIDFDNGQPSVLEAKAQPVIDRVNEHLLEQEEDAAQQAYFNETAEPVRPSGPGLGDLSGRYLPDPSVNVRPSPAEPRLEIPAQDVRLTRPEYRSQLYRMASELIKGGGVGYVRDSHDRIVSRTPSLNPDWFKALNENPDTGMSVEDVQAAIQKALAGERLGVRQLRVVGAALDTITEERGSYARDLRVMRENAREDRRRAYEQWREATNVPIDAEFESIVWPENPGDQYLDTDYLPDHSMDDRATSELVNLADTLGVEWAAIEAALSAGDINSQTQALTQLIWETRNDHRKASGTSGQPTAAPAGAPGRSAEGERADRVLEKESPDTAQPAAQIIDAVAASDAATSPENNLPEPTDAQKEAGNYKKAHVRVQGLDISIENARGSTRSGVDREGNPWSVVMHNHYGYLKRTEGADGENVDVFIGPNPDSQKVFIVDQVSPDGTFDEHKVLLGFDSKLKARSGYKSNYTKGWKVGPITSMAMDEFKAWLKNGDTTKPLKADHFPDSGKLVSDEPRPSAGVSVSEVGQRVSNPDELANQHSNSKPTKPAAPIHDFGEKIEGARKDYASSLTEAMDKDIASVPLSESWPEPNYQKLLDGGMPAESVALIHALRDEVPVKPRMAWKLKGWASHVRDLRAIVMEMMHDPQIVQALGNEIESHRTLRKITNRASLYEAVGHGKSLKGIDFSEGSYSIFDGVNYSPEKTFWTVVRDSTGSSFGNLPRRLAAGESKEQAISAFKKLYESLDSAQEKATKAVRFDIYTDRHTGDVFIGKKIGRNVARVKTGLGSVKEARSYLKDNQAELEKLLDRMKDIPSHRRGTNAPRVGIDHRNGGDVTPEQFSEAFGFRGVQFGNAVEQKRRQRDLNEAYDALMDLAGILNLPPKALSLNGELGLAFGARGKGGKNAAKAHYESDQVVINLTKRDGAGSLAHEWWHALDNYFTRERGGQSPHAYASEGSAHISVRREMAQAFRDVASAVARTRIQQRSSKLDVTRTRPYWATGREMFARAFESYVVEKLRDQGLSNDYLANIVGEDYWNAATALGLEKADTYPYPEAAEIPVIRAAFDDFFEVVETRQTDSGIALFSFAGERAATADTHALEAAKERLDAGDDAETVRRETGWHQAKDGKWRFEINDADAKLKKPFPFKGQKWGAIVDGVRERRNVAAQPLTLGELIDHPPLFAAYPFLSEMTITDESGAGASYRPYSSSYGPAHIAIGRDVVMSDARSVLLHEIQHAIQHVEGFATGASPGYFRDRDITGEAVSKINKKITDLLNSSPDFGNLVRQKNSDYLRLKEQHPIKARNGETVANWDKVPDAERDNYYALLDKIDTFPESRELSDLEFERARIVREGVTQSAHLQYHYQHGEVEARNTERRRTLNDEQRRATPPSRTQDVADSDIIVAFNGQVMRSAPTPANAANLDRKVKVGEVGRRTSVSEVEAHGIVVRILDGIRGRHGGEGINELKGIFPVESFADFPAAVRHHAGEQGHDNQSVEGVFHKGSIYINRAALRTGADVERVVFHELYGHYGIRRLFGVSTKGAMNRLYMAIGGAKGLNQVAARHNIDLRHYARGYLGEVQAGRMDRETMQSIMAEELLAHLAQDNQPSIKRAAREVIGAIRTWLRSKGFLRLSKVSDSELFHLLKQARQVVETGQVLGNQHTLFALKGKTGGELGTVFSLSDLPANARRIIGDDPVLAGWTMLTQNDEAFQLPTSSKKMLTAIFKELEGDSGMRVERADELAMQNDYGAKMSWRVTTANGEKAAIYQKGKSVWIDVSALKQGEDGKRIYNAVANYAHNTDRVFIGDPAGLSDVALTRRLENMISSALKFGTTKHLWPHDRQIEGNEGMGVPAIQWKDGNDAHNLRQMIDASYQATAKQFPEIRDLRYNPEKDVFEDVKTGGVWDHARFDNLAKKARGESAGVRGADSRADGSRPPISDSGVGTVGRGQLNASNLRQPAGPVRVVPDRGGVGVAPTAGSTTLERAVLTHTLLRSSRSEVSDILAQFGGFGSERLTGDNAILYSLNAHPEPRPQGGVSRSGVAKNISSLRKQLELMGVESRITERADAINVAKIVVHKDQRNAGLGTTAMQAVIEYADSVDKRVELSPSSDFGGSKLRLRNFYKRLGFVENAGANRNYEISETMYRNPQPSAGVFASGVDQTETATGNSGAFDPADPDIRFSLKNDPGSLLSEGEKAALDKLGLKPAARQSIIRRIASITTKDIRALVDAAKQRAYEGIFDGLIGIKRAEEASGTGIGGGDYAGSGYVGAVLATGTADVMHHILEFGAVRWDGGVLQPVEDTHGLLQILGDLGADMRDWLAWMGANRAAELMKQGRENNLTREDVISLISRAKGKLEKFKKAKAKYNKLNKAMLDIAEEAGLIDPDSRKDWESEWYVPFYRRSESDGTPEIMAPSTNRGLSHQSSGIKALKGGELATNNLLDNILTNWLKLADASLKNSALLKTVDNLKDTELLKDESIRYQKAIVSRAQIAQQIRTDRKVLRSVAEFLGMPEGADAIKVAGELMKPENKGFEQLWAAVAPTDPDIIRVKRNGKSEYYQVSDPALLRAVSHLGFQGFNDPVMRGMRFFKRLLTTGVTTSPDFMIRNFLRDIVHAWTINPDGMKLGSDAVKGIAGAFREDADYRSLVASGAAFQGGYVHGADPEASAQLVRRAVYRRGLKDIDPDSVLTTWGKVWEVVQKGWQTYRGWGDKVENTNRLATFKRALKAGKPLAQAVYEAKDLMDYSRRGNFMAMMMLTDMIPFLNARVQGFGKLGRAATEHKRTVAIRSGMIAAVSVMLAMLNADNEDYEELPEWEKDAYWHFWIGDDHWRIPKPFEIGIVAGTFPERIALNLVGAQENEKLAWTLRHNLLGTFGFSGPWGLPMPQAMQPIIETAANRSFYFDSPVEGMADEGKVPEARYDASTSDTMIKLGEWTGTSPKKLQHMLEGYTGTMGAYALGLVDVATRWAVDHPGKPQKHIEDLPAFRTLYRGDSPRSNRYVAQLYDDLTKAEQVYRTIESYRGEGKDSLADKLIDKHEEKLAALGLLRRARSDLSQIRKAILDVQNDRELTAKEKRERLDELIRFRNEIAKDAVQSVRQSTP